MSEPESEKEDCLDIGYAYVDINDILKANQNYLNKEIKRKNIHKILSNQNANLYLTHSFLFEVFDADNPKEQIGKMVVTVEILDALLAVKREMAMEETL